MEGSISNRRQTPRNSTPDVPKRMLRSFRHQSAEIQPLQQVLITVLRRKWFILSFALLGGLFGLAGLARPALYLSTVQLIIDLPGRERGANNAIVSQDVFDSTIDDHLTMLVSRDQLHRGLLAIRKADEEAARSAPPPAKPSPIGQMVAVVQGIRDWAIDHVRRLKPALQTSQTDSGFGDADALAKLRKSLAVGQELRSRVITVGFSDPNPARAARMANAYVGSYIDDLIRRNLATAKSELAAVKAALPSTRQQFASATDDVEHYRLTHASRDTTTPDETTRELAQLDRQLALAEAERDSVSRQIEAATRLQQSSAKPTSVAAAANLQPELHALPGKTTQAVDRLKVQEQIYSSQIAALRQRKRALHAAAAENGNQLSELKVLELRADIASQRFRDLLTSSEHLQQRIESTRPGLSILSSASPQNRPRTLSPVFLVPPGIIVFGLFAAMIAVTERSRDRTLRSVEEAEKSLGISCLGLLPRFRRPKARHIAAAVQSQSRSVHSRAAGDLLLNLRLPGDAMRLPRIILVTASTANEAKAELAWTLALVATRALGRVLVVDFDVQPDRLSKDFCTVFGDKQSTRSFDLDAAEPSKPEDAIEQLAGLDIHYLPVWSRLGDPLGQLSSRALSPMFKDLCKAYPLIVVLAPCVADGPEAGLLAGWADAVLFAVDWGGKDRDLVRNAVDLVTHQCADPAPLACVLTRVDLARHARYRFGDSADLLNAGAVRTGATRAAGR